MAGFMASYTDQTYALMRIVLGLLFLCHGGAKLFGFPGDWSQRRSLLSFSFDRDQLYTQRHHLCCNS